LTGSGVRCDYCGTPTVYPAGIATSGVEEWRCTTCRDLRRWCKECNQGWIRRFRLRTTGAELYSCDECEGAWPSPEDLAADGSDRRSLLKRLGGTGDWEQVEPVPDRD